METKNDNLIELLNRFFEAGVLKLVYKSDNAIVCNVFNQYYVAFSVPICRKYTEQFPGFVINSKGLRTVLEDDEYINYHFSALSEETQKASLAYVDEVLLQHMIKNKSEFEKRPPKIDLEFEKAVIELGKGALELFPDEEEKPKKRRFFGLF